MDWLEANAVYFVYSDKKHRQGEYCGQIRLTGRTGGPIDLRSEIDKAIAAATLRKERQNQ
jgi:hypothetical protein